MTKLTHPQLGDIEVEWGYEPRTGNQVVTVEQVTNLAGTIVWYMPDRDHWSIEKMIYEGGAWADRYYDDGDDYV